MKQRRSDTEASSSESDESSLPSDDDSEEEPIPPLIIRRTKQGRKMHFQLVAHGDSDEEADEERADDEDEEEEEDADMDEESDAEEAAEDDVSKVRLRRLTSTTLRLQRLPDATPPDTKTRHALAVTLARYKCQTHTAHSLEKVEPLLLRLACSLHFNVPVFMLCFVSAQSLASRPTPLCTCWPRTVTLVASRLPARCFVVSAVATITTTPR